jgi:hypothetical protein
MSNYARVNSENIVVYVTHIPDDLIVDEEGIIDESKGVDILYSTIPDSVGDTWIMTCPEGNFRRRYAGIGYIWHDDLNIFTVPKPYDSWILCDEDPKVNIECPDWNPPIPFPETPAEDGYMYVWNEELYQSDNSKGWQLVQNSFI